MRFFVLISLLMNGLFTQAATVKSAQSGDWTSGSTWEGGSAPSCGDSIVIVATHSVAITSQINYSCGNKTTVVVRGSLYFNGGSKLMLPCSSRVYVFGNGELTSDGGGSSNRLEMCGTVYWKATDGKLSGPACVPATLPGCNQVMPVELAKFEGTEHNGEVTFVWLTMIELNNAGFRLQRLENDRFVDVHYISSKAPGGDSRRPLSYEAVDTKPQSGINYYRLMQVDTDSSFSYSKIVVVNVSLPREGMVAYPNPSTGDFLLKLPRAEQGVVAVYNSSGELLRQIAVDQTGERKITGLKAGVYSCFFEGAVIRVIVSQD
jgi:hypothetical protein